MSTSQSRRQGLRCDVVNAGEWMLLKPCDATCCGLFGCLSFSRRLQIRRRPLATSQYLTSHSKDPANSKCAHYFVDPLSWMRTELEQGKLEGRIECPNCHSNVGKYAWQGMQCSCGEWLVPGISLSKGRIDEARKGGVTGIRRPPGAPGAPPSNQSTSRQNL
jgi:dual specificity phosphatase 12